MNTPQTKRGFTLIEMIVSLGLFTIVLFITTSAFLAIVNADRKSRATRVATDNLNLALENMSRKIKTGYTYNCGGGSGANDCVVPQSIFEFTDQSGSRVSYKRAQGTAECGSGYGVNQGCILRLDAGVPVLSTSPEIDITSLKFLVSGSALWPDTKQPAVVIAIEGAIGVNAGNPSGKSSFKIQTILTQRIYDH